MAIEFSLFMHCIVNFQVSLGFWTGKTSTSAAQLYYNKLIPNKMAPISSYSLRAAILMKNLSNKVIYNVYKYYARSRRSYFIGITKKKLTKKYITIKIKSLFKKCVVKPMSGSLRALENLVKTQKN